MPYLPTYVTSYIQKLSSNEETTATVENTVSEIGDMANGVTSIAKAISEYGYVIVIMAIFFVMFLGLAVLVLKSNSKMISQLMKRQDTSDQTEQQIINKFVETALAAYGTKNDDNIKGVINELKESLRPLESAIKDLNSGNAGGHYNNSSNEDNDYHKDLVGAFIDVNMAFKDASRTALETLKCERVAIYVFHNGNTSIHGLPFFKMSCIHEWNSKGSATLRGKYHSDIPLHLFNGFVEILWRDGVYKIDNIDEEELKNDSIKEFVAFSNTKSLYLVGISDSDSKLAGFISVEFSNPDTFTTDDTRDTFVKSTIDKMAAKIAPIIANHYVYQKKKD